MKKTILFFYIVSLLSISSVAQTNNVNIDNFRFSYGYRAFPAKPLDPIRFNYAVKINASPLIGKNVFLKDIYDAVRIRGQVKVINPEEAQVFIELKLENIMISKTEITERKQETKDKEGKVTSTKYFYRLKVTYTFESSYRITKDEKLLIQNSINSRYSNHTFQTTEYNSRKDAEDFWNNNKDALISDFHKDLSFKAAETVSNKASELYGFNALNSRGLLKTMNEKKHNENDTFRAMMEVLKTELQAMTPNEKLNKAGVAEVIEYFKSLPKKYSDPKSKADQRIRYAAYYNLSVIYYHLDEPENVKQFANLIAPNGYDPKDGEKLNKSAQELINAFKITGIHTRHFSPDVYFGGGNGGEDDNWIGEDSGSDDE